jgi:hypothetical protein
MTNPMNANAFTHLSGWATGDANVVSGARQSAGVSEDSAHATSLGSMMGFTWKNNPWLATTDTSDFNYSLANQVSIDPGEHAPTDPGHSQGFNASNQMGSNQAFFEFDGAWSAVGAFGMGNFDPITEHNQLSA